MNDLIRREQLVSLTVAHFKEITREKGVLFWGIIFPILMSLGLGIAFTKKADVVRRIAVVEPAVTAGAAPNAAPGAPDSASVINAFLRDHTKRVAGTGGEPDHYEIEIPDEKLGSTTFIFVKATWSEAMVLLKRGNLSVAIEEENGAVRYHFDPRNADAQLTYLRLSRLFERTDEPAAAAEDGVEPLTVSGTRYIDFLIPGLIAMGIMMSSLWGMSYGMVEKRSKKLLRRMVATPMKKSHFLVAMMTVRTGMNFVEAVLLFLFAHLVFQITIQGDVSALLVIFLAGNIAFAGIAIFFSARTANTEIANGLINAVSLPMVVMSGVFFSYHNFPGWLVPVIQKMPLTLLADGMRSIFIEGTGYAGVAIPSLILAATGVVFFAAGLRVFRWY
jgi:ABC-2 type transport system permease protein